MSETVPVIGLAAGDDGAVEAIADACRHWGFFYLADHGIPAPLIDDVLGHARRFFALPPADRRALGRTKENPRGYDDRELTKNARDLKEVLDFGGEPYPDLASDDPRNTLPVDGHRLPHLFCLGLGVPRGRLDPYFGPDHTSFIRLNHYSLGDPLASTIGADGPHYRPVNWGHFRQARTDGDHADYGKEIQVDDLRLV